MPCLPTISAVPPILPAQRRHYRLSIRAKNGQRAQVSAVTGSGSARADWFGLGPLYLLDQGRGGFDGPICGYRLPID